MWLVAGSAGAQSGPAGGFSPPANLRPCCAFGTGLGVRLASLPFPMVQLENIVSADDLGRHRYDGGLVSSKHGVRQGFVSSEANGLVYTCRGGFIDVAHVRDYADWTVFLARWIGSALDRGGVRELPVESGRRFVYLTAVDAGFAERVGRRALAVALARWLAFQLSVWHEVATWYGWSSLGLFPETASAFSPEDLYSNLLGAEIGARLALAGETGSEARYNRAMDRELTRSLAALVPLRPEATARALAAVDGLWWDSTARLPDRNLVLRRNLAIGPELRPWRVPLAGAAPELRDELDAACAGTHAQSLRVGDDVGGVALRALARLDVRAAEEAQRALAARLGPSPWLDPAALRATVARVESEVRRAFGPQATRPAP